MTTEDEIKRGIFTAAQPIFRAIEATNRSLLLNLVGKVDAALRGSPSEQEGIETFVDLVAKSEAQVIADGGESLLIEFPMVRTAIAQRSTQPKKATDTP